MPEQGRPKTKPHGRKPVQKSSSPVRDQGPEKTQPRTKTQHSPRPKQAGSSPYKSRHRRPPRPRTGKMPAPPKPVITSYSQPSKQCDIVMNGGVVSGIVHPAAVEELAKTFSFVNIGGSSIGAFSAAATAAAEKGRNSKKGGFTALKGVLDWLTQKQDGQAELNIQRMLQPDKSTKKFYSFAKKLEQKKSGKDFIASAFSAIPQFVFPSLLSALPGVGLILASLFTTDIYSRIFGLLFGALLIVLVPPVVASICLFTGLKKVLAQNNFGFCSGLATTDTESDESFISWMSSTLNRLAGNENPDQILTFGDLWGTRVQKEERAINLKLLATDVSHGLPLELPFEEPSSPRPEDIYYFKREEMLKLFPEKIVELMVQKSRRGAHYRRVKGFFPLSEAADMPVLFALRLSVSIPVLISAVPLYRMSRIRQKGGARWSMSKCWISGGGLSGSQRIDAFDQPLPRRPTFAIHIAPVGYDSTDKQVQKKGIWVQNLISQHGPLLWQGFNNFDGFAKAAGTTIYNWQENRMLQIPGFKERIAIVKVSKAQTGLCPELDKETADHLCQLAVSAAGQLRDRFGSEIQSPKSLSWDAHRWIRFRQLMARLEQYLIDLRKAYYNVEASEASYDHLIMRNNDEAPDAYRWLDTSQRNHALRVTNQLLNFIERWQKDRYSFASGDMPEPHPVFKLTPE